MVVISLWWQYGSPISEESAYKLALEDLKIYASRNEINLSNYNYPVLKGKNDLLLYEFKWVSRKDKKVLIVVVDGRTIDIAIEEEEAK